MHHIPEEKHNFRIILLHLHTRYYALVTLTTSSLLVGGHRYAHKSWLICSVGWSVMCVQQSAYGLNCWDIFFFFFLRRYKLQRSFGLLNKFLPFGPVSVAVLPVCYFHPCYIYKLSVLFRNTCRGLHPLINPEFSFR